MNVLSLFDGLSCGNIALERAGIKVNNYYASEVDKWAIQIANKNYPNIIQLGDVLDVKAKDLPHKIDLLIGGSPCQDLSFAGKGKGLSGDRSSLFYQYFRLLKECKPKYFLLENVRMKKEYSDIISDLLGVEPIEINSSLVSAQNRKRLYWTNIPGIKQPEDRGIVLRDILETETDERPVKDTKRNQRHYKNEDQKSLCMSATMYKGAGNNGMTLVPQKSKQVCGHREPKVNTSETTYRKLTPLECERLQTIPDGYSEGVSNTQRYRMLGNSWTASIIAHLFKGLKDG